jgi:hypothetical protein
MKGGLERLKGVYRYVFATAYKWRKRTGAVGQVFINRPLEGRPEGRYPLNE